MGFKQFIFIFAMVTILQAHIFADNHHHMPMVHSQEMFISNGGGNNV